jgi:hypothetical protein
VATGKRLLDKDACCARVVINSMEPRMEKISEGMWRSRGQPGWETELEGNSDKTNAETDHWRVFQWDGGSSWAGRFELLGIELLLSRAFSFHLASCIKNTKKR